MFDDLMLSALKTGFRTTQNDNVMNVIPNENTNYVYEFSEFKFSDFIFIDYSMACMDTQKRLHQYGFHQFEKARSW